MKTKIYYFSGTGNSLFVAKELAKHINCTYESIPKSIKQIHSEENDHLIIIFPSYLAIMYGFPVIVKEFIDRIPHISEKIITAICLCGGYEIVNAVPSIFAFEKHLKTLGGSLFDYYTLRFPMNNLDYEHIPIPIEKNINVILNKAERKIKHITMKIQKNKRTKIQKPIHLIIQLLLKPVYIFIKKASYQSILEKSKEAMTTTKSIEEVIRLTDRSISANDKCIGCGLCVEICPVNNIKLINGKPSWLHQCEMCFTCHEWCPQKAITHWGRKGGIYYHHPMISLKDFLNN